MPTPTAIATATATAIATPTTTSTVTPVPTDTATPKPTATATLRPANTATATSTVTATVSLEVDFPIVGKVDLAQYTQEASLQDAINFWKERGTDLGTTIGTVITFRTVQEFMDYVKDNKIPQPGGVVMSTGIMINNSVAEKVTDTTSTARDRTGTQQPVIKYQLHKPKTPDLKSSGVIYKGAPLAISWRIPSDAKGGITPDKLVLVQIADDYHKYITDEQLSKLIDNGITLGIYNLTKNAFPGIVFYLTP